MFVFFYKAQKNLLNVILEFVILPLSDKTLLSAITICVFQAEIQNKNLHILLYTYITKEILKIPTFGNFFPSNFTFGSIGDMQKNNNAVSADEIFKINSNK
jgi:hypothetical protein